MGLLSAAEVVYDLTPWFHPLPTGPNHASLSPAGTKHFPSQGHEHNLALTQTFRYNSNPPTSGPHAEMYPAAVVNLQQVETARLVHMLEHGNIVIVYHQLPQSQLHQLEDWVQSKNPPAADAHLKEDAEQGKLVFLCPWNSIPAGHVDALAWTRLYDIAGFQSTGLNRFVEAWQHNLTNMNQ